jgi:hypothetical protein
VRTRRLFVCGIIILLANSAHAARYQRCKDGKTLVWNSQRGVAQEATWSGRRDVKGYATGGGTLTWYRLNEEVNSYTGKMVEGKLEGMVIKVQARTRLQAKFANGERVGDWSELDSFENTRPTPSPTLVASATTAKPKMSPVATPVATPPPARESEILPTPIPFRSPTRSKISPTPFPTPIATPTATPMPFPTRTPTVTPTPSPMPTQVGPPNPTPTPRSTSTPSPSPTAPPPILKSLPSPPMPELSGNTPRLEEMAEVPARDAVVLTNPPPSSRNTIEEAPFAEPSVSSALPSITGSKSEMIAQFKAQTASVFAQVRDATEKFRDVGPIDSLKEFPAPVSASVEALAGQARDFRSKVGYEVAMYECGAETATADALLAANQARRELAQKNAPVGRSRLVSFFKRYPASPSEEQRLLWRYNASILMACDKAKKEAEGHLPQAKAFEAAGKKTDALREYKEIYRVYPNGFTADKIKLLQESPH